MAKKYNFGRTELLPVRTDSQRLAAYLAKYLSKGERTTEDKGAQACIVLIKSFESLYTKFFMV
jgi:hypothetical protein